MKKHIGSIHSQSFSSRTFRAAEVEPRERGEEPPDVVREAQRGAAEVGHGAAGQPGQAEQGLRRDQDQHQGHLEPHHEPHF